MLLRYSFVVLVLLRKMMLKIRSSNPSDVDTIASMEKLCFEAHLQYGSSILFNILNSAKYISLTANLIQEGNGKIAGCAIGERDQDKTNLGRIVLIIVDPELQRNNIGAELLSALEEKLGTMFGIELFELQVHYKNEKALFFYQKNGYRISKRIRNYYERSEHAFLMDKKIVD